MDKSYKNRTIILLILCIFSIVLFAALIGIYIVLYQTINILSLIFIVGYIVAVIGVFTKQKYGFISALITSALASLIFIIGLSLLGVIIFGSILVLAILEYRDYEKNYQMETNQKPTSIATQQQSYPPPVYQQSIQNEKPKFCPNCGEAADGQYCRACGKKLE